MSFAAGILDTFESKKRKAAEDAEVESKEKKKERDDTRLMDIIDRHATLKVGAFDHRQHHLVEGHKWGNDYPAVVHWMAALVLTGMQPGNMNFLGVVCNLEVKFPDWEERIEYINVMVTRIKESIWDRNNQKGFDFVKVPFRPCQSDVVNEDVKFLEARWRDYSEVIYVLMDRGLKEMSSYYRTRRELYVWEYKNQKESQNVSSDCSNVKILSEVGTDNLKKAKLLKKAKRELLLEIAFSPGITWWNQQRGWHEYENIVHHHFYLMKQKYIL